MHVMHTPSTSAGRGGGAGLSPCDGQGGEGGGGAVHALGWGGGQGGRQGTGYHLRGACTPGLGRVKDDLHPVALQLRPHELAAGKPHPRGGILPRAGVLVLRV